ncbi:hypothetical protein L1049_025934 [Liquidambar formosana]|uniref:O-fucosyltransferase family protein n=1 Tax=Liquidambar formosana TaxID=63359 RepID=A0AAP0NC71_LIQFO
MATTAMKPKSYLHIHHHHHHSTTCNGYSSESSSPSPPPSPRRHSSLSYCRRRPRSKSHSQPRRDNFIAGIFLRLKHRYLLVLPLFYISGLLMCVGPFSAFVGHPPLPGSVYRSHEIFQKLWDDIQSDNSSAIELSSVWRHKRRLKEQKPCLNTTAGREFASPGSSGYLIVDANGGLNQQRSSICNAVAVAGLLNAILVIPRFDFHSVWQDPSNFGDIYDEGHFIATLKGHVEVVRELPEELMEIYDYNISNIPNIHVQAWAPVSYYLGEVYPVLLKQGVIHIAPFANRLAMNVPPHIQFLRCLANYEALRFSFSISTLAKKTWWPSHVVCMMEVRLKILKWIQFAEKGWRGKFKRKDRVIKPGLNRVNGKCPLTPLEVGMMLRGMGFDNNTLIYLASGKIYQAERNLAPLLTMFPLLQTKESLATPDELAPFKGYSSRLAALDYLVCLFSEVFVTTQGGNFPHFLMGHRRFLYDGHAKTVKPDKRKLVVLLDNVGISWKDFKNQMEGMLTESDHEGIKVPRTRKAIKKASIYSYPLPQCRCLQESQNSTLKSINTFHMLDHQMQSMI